MDLICCKSKSDFEKALVVTRDYMEWLQMDLGFQNTEREFQIFDEMYGLPTGVFLLLSEKGTIAGGVGCRFLEPGICEMKRLFIYNQARGRGLGRYLCSELLIKAKSMGYLKMRLDTVSRLKSANKLYENEGFYDIGAYCENPDETARYMEKVL